MRIFLLIFMLLQMGFAGLCQVMEAFDDGEIDANPPWSGDRESFVVNEDLLLQLNAQEAGAFFLSTPNTLCDSTEWIIYVRQKFSPSANNHSCIWLMSDTENRENRNGYFLRLGESGSADVPELFLCEDGVEISVLRCDGPDISKSSAFVFRVVRDNSGFWSAGILVESGVFQQTGAGFNDRICTTSWFGIECRCTSSNTGNFYFDDIIIRHTYLDMEAPEPWSVKTKGRNMVVVEMSEPVCTTQAVDINNYTLTPGGIHPVGAGLIPGEENKIQMLFEHNFSDGVEYKLEVKNLEDAAGNVMEPSFLWFLYAELKIGSVVISEIMADINPAPPGLPAVEYLELLNTTDGDICLQNFYLKINNKDYNFDKDYVLTPDSAVVITDIMDSVYDDSIFVDGLSIPNSSCEIVLEDAEGFPLCWLIYDNRAHEDYKRDGGWSLEMIDGQSMCLGLSNYASSEDVSGGTPGTINSVNGENPDVMEPFIAHAVAVAPDSVVLYFNEPVLLYDEEEILSLTDGYCILGVFEGEPWKRRISILIDPQLQPGEILEIFPGDGIKDCAGNICESKKIKTALPQTSDPQDIVINEILFNPEEGFYDYVELYNASRKTLSLSDLAFSLYDTVTYSPYNLKSALDESSLLFAGEYIVVTKDTSGFYWRYPAAGKINALLGDYLPVLPNDGGSLALVSFHDNELIDHFSYSSAMHYPLLYSEKGVSLERVDKGVWHSSGELNGFGTPGYANSHVVQPGINGGEIEIIPRVITPDNDGKDDIATIVIHALKEHEAGDIYIYDRYGYRIRTLRENLLLSTDNTLFWDGTDERGKTVTTGTYLVVASLRGRFGINAPVRASISVGL